MHGYSYEFAKKVRALALRKDAPIGVKLGLKAVERGIPVSHIASTLEVSRMAVYDWFTGKYTPEHTKLQQLKLVLSGKTK
jgi:hypothetical protein